MEASPLPNTRQPHRGPEPLPHKPVHTGDFDRTPCPQLVWNTGLVGGSSAVECNQTRSVTQLQWDIHIAPGLAPQDTVAVQDNCRPPSPASSSENGAQAGVPGLANPDPEWACQQLWAQDRVLSLPPSLPVREGVPGPHLGWSLVPIGDTHT
jgi:hypothetical protein